MLEGLGASGGGGADSVANLRKALERTATRVLAATGAGASTLRVEALSAAKDMAMVVVAVQDAQEANKATYRRPEPGDQTLFPRITWC